MKWSKTLAAQNIFPSTISLETSDLCFDTNCQLTSKTDRDDDIEYRCACGKLFETINDISDMNSHRSLLRQVPICISSTSPNLLFDIMIVYDALVIGWMSGQTGLSLPSQQKISDYIFKNGYCFWKEKKKTKTFSWGKLLLIVA